MSKIRDGRLQVGVPTANVDRIIWQSKVIDGLVMTENMLKLLHDRYFIVKSWQPFMLDLEKYLAMNPHKMPKDFKKFVLKCAPRHADDVKRGYRWPDGKVNLKAFAHRGPDKVTRDPSLTEEMLHDEQDDLRDKLKTLERGTPEYEETLVKLQRARYNTPTLSIGQVLQKLAGIKQENLFQSGAELPKNKEIK